MSASTTARTPVHLWVVGIIATLWNAMGAFDYLMTQTGNKAYLSQFSTEQLAYYDSYPLWATAAWAIAVWSAVAGSALLLLRRRAAVPTFAAALLALIFSMLYTYVLSSGGEISGTGSMVFMGVIFVVAVALVFYARTMARRGVLR